MLFTIYDSSTGIILRSGSGGHQELADGESLYEGLAFDASGWKVNLETGVPEEWTPPKNQAELLNELVAERDRRLAVGFSHTFADSRGTHVFATTAEDMAKWSEVTDLASAAAAMGLPNTEIAIKTATGATTVTAAEWPSVLLSAAAFRQPIYQAYFAIKAMDPLPEDVTAPELWGE